MVSMIKFPKFISKIFLSNKIITPMIIPAIEGAPLS